MIIAGHAGSNIKLQVKSFNTQKEKLTLTSGQADKPLHGLVETRLEPSPGYAGVSLSLANPELNAHGLHRTDGLMLSQFCLLIFLIVWLK
jgi:hypothetical protein